MWVAEGAMASRTGTYFGAKSRVAIAEEETRAMLGAVESQDARASGAFGLTVKGAARSTGVNIGEDETVSSTLFKLAGRASGAAAGRLREAARNYAAVEGGYATKEQLGKVGAGNAGRMRTFIGELLGEDAMRSFDLSYARGGMGVQEEIAAQARTGMVGAAQNLQITTDLAGQLQSAYGVSAEQARNIIGTFSQGGAMSNAGQFSERLAAGATRGIDYGRFGTSRSAANFLWQGIDAMFGEGGSMAYTKFGGAADMSERLNETARRARLMGTASGKAFAALDTAMTARGYGAETVVGRLLGSVLGNRTGEKIGDVLAGTISDEEAAKFTKPLAALRSKVAAIAGDRNIRNKETAIGAAVAEFEAQLGAEGVAEKAKSVVGDKGVKGAGGEADTTSDIAADISSILSILRERLGRRDEFPAVERESRSDLTGGTESSAWLRDGSWLY
jgi:hypothetical protein